MVSKIIITWENLREEIKNSYHKPRDESFYIFLDKLEKNMRMYLSMPDDYYDIPLPTEADKPKEEVLWL